VQALVFDAKGILYIGGFLQMQLIHICVNGMGQIFRQLE